METEYSKDTLATLKNLLLKHVFSGETAQKVVRFLFRVYGSPDRISARDISDNGGPKEENVCPMMSRMRDELTLFFWYDPIGRKEPLRVMLHPYDPGNYAIWVVPNDPPAELVKPFWGPHSKYPGTQVVYSEIPNAGSASSNFQVLNADEARGCGVVAAPIVRAAFRISETFAKWGVRVTPTSVRPSVEVIQGGMIALGTPLSMPLLLQNYEGGASMRTGPEGASVLVGSKARPILKEYFDTSEEVNLGNTRENVRWAVITRHSYPFQPTTTLIAARSELAVEASMEFLTNEGSIAELAKELRSPDIFPDHFQALLCARYFKGQPFARRVTIEKAFDLSDFAAPARASSNPASPAKEKTMSGNRRAKAPQSNSKFISSY